MIPVWLFPVLSTVFALIAFFSGYTIGRLNDHEDAWIPFVSDGGALPPESCIFAMFLNLSAFFGIFTGVVQYYHIKMFFHYDDKNNNKGWHTYNFILLIIGYIISIGIMLIANFQETSILLMHDIGAMIAFIFGIIYLWGHMILIILRKIYSCQMRYIYLRSFLIVITTFAFVAYMIIHYSKPFVPRESDGSLPPKPPKIDGIIRPSSDSPYYTNHAVAAFMEWFMIIGLFLSQLMFTFELRNTALQPINLRPRSPNKLFTRIGIASLGFGNISPVQLRAKREFGKQTITDLPSYNC